MPRLADARVLTRRETGYEFDEDGVDAIVAEQTAAREARSAFCVPTESTTFPVAFVTGGDNGGEMGASGPTSCIKRESSTQNYRVSTKATSVTSTTVSTAGMLLRASRRDEMLKRLSPERRATFDRIRRLREEIGPVSFNIVRELRELRSHG